LELARNALIVYDVNLRQAWFDRDSVERSLNACDIVKLNADEVVVLAALLGTKDPDPAMFARAIRERYGVNTTCVTRAENGCVLIDETESIDLPGIDVDVIDAVGAGDAFTAAMISARLRGWPLRATATLANLVGAVVAGRAGAMPAIGDELADLIQRAREANADDA
jgi:fructokinase